MTSLKEDAAVLQLAGFRPSGLSFMLWNYSSRLPCFGLAPYALAGFPRQCAAVTAGSLHHARSQALPTWGPADGAWLTISACHSPHRWTSHELRQQLSWTFSHINMLVFWICVWLLPFCIHSVSHFAIWKTLFVILYTQFVFAHRHTCCFNHQGCCAPQLETSPIVWFGTKHRLQPCA